MINWVLPGFIRIWTRLYLDSLYLWQPLPAACFSDAPCLWQVISWRSQSRILILILTWCQVRTASCGAANCVNTFGDEQLAVDLLADKLLFEALKFSVRPPPHQPHMCSLLSS